MFDYEPGLEGFLPILIFQDRANSKLKRSLQLKRSNRNLLYLGPLCSLNQIETLFQPVKASLLCDDQIDWKANPSQ